MELVSIKEALDILEHNAPKNPRRQWGVMVRMATNTVAKALADRKTGRWIRRHSKMWECSECERGCRWRENYCPDCGAKMEVDE